MMLCSFCGKVLREGLMTVFKDERGAQFHLPFCDEPCMVAWLSGLRLRIAVPA